MFSASLSQVSRGISVIQNRVLKHSFQGEQFFSLCSQARRNYHSYPGNKASAGGFIQPRNLCDINAVRNACLIKGIQWQSWWGQVFDQNSLYDDTATWVEGLDSSDRTLENPNTRMAQFTPMQPIWSSPFWAMFSVAQSLPGSLRPKASQISAQDITSALDQHDVLVLSVNNMALPGSKYRTHHTITAFDYQQTGNGILVYSIDGDETTALGEHVRDYALAKGIPAADITPHTIRQIAGDHHALIRADPAEMLAAHICRPILAFH